MYRSYTLNNYLDSLKGVQPKNQPKQSSNKSLGAGHTYQASSTKTQSNADNKQATKTMYSSFVNTPVKAESNVNANEPMRYMKSSSIGTYSYGTEAKGVEPTKHQILSTGTYYKYNSDIKPKVVQEPVSQPQPQPITLTAPSKTSYQNYQSYQLPEATKSEQTKQITSFTSTPIKVVNPQVKTQPESQIVSERPPVQAVTNEPQFRLEKKDSMSIEQSTLFSEFKIKYDQLKMNYDKQRQELDDVTREKKKLQIKFLNANPQYYEKQIKRLRAEVEKYQQENEDHKYKYLQAENGKKQYEASAKVKQEELRVIIKQLQKQKISNVELRHQNDEKERVFGRIKMEFERSNQSTLKNYDQAVTKANRLDGALKTKVSEYDQLQKSFERQQRKFNELKDEYKKYKEINQEKVKNLTKMSETKNIEYIKIKTEMNSKIDELTEEVDKLKSERISADLLKTRKTEQVSIIKSNRQLELDIVRLEDRIRLLEHQLVQKDQMVIQLQKTINKLKIQEDIKEYEERIANLVEQKNDLTRELQKIKSDLMRQNETLRLDLMRAPEKVIHAGNANFQEILRVQLEENSKLKRELSHKIDQVYNLKSDIDELKVGKQNLLSEIEVLKKIKKSEEKNVKIQAEIASQHIKNDMESYKRKVQLLQVKLNLKSKQVKQKDAFIMNSVLGRCKQEQVPLILADFQRIFEANYVDRIAEANQRIEDLVQSKK